MIEITEMSLNIDNITASVEDHCLTADYTAFFAASKMIKEMLVIDGTVIYIISDIV